jgi:hypothetical protein
MKEITKYINSLTIPQLVAIYRDEYLPFKETGICCDGEIRKIAEMSREFSHSLYLEFACRLLLEKWTEIFYIQNEK